MAGEYRLPQTRRTPRPTQTRCLEIFLSCFVNFYLFLLTQQDSLDSRELNAVLARGLAIGPICFFPEREAAANFEDLSSDRCRILRFIDNVIRSSSENDLRLIIAASKKL